MNSNSSISSSSISDRITDKMLKFQLEAASQNVGFPLRLSIWNPDGRRRYQLVAEDDGTEMNYVMDKSYMYSNLFTLNSLYSKIHAIKLRRYQQKMQEEKQLQ
jgi:hypothetical protein